MALTKAEKERLERTEKALAMARSMRWPEYPMPHSMTGDEIRAALVNGGLKYGQPERVARGWFQNSHSKRVTYGCSNGVSHNTEGDATSTQQAGQMFAAKIDALKAMRIEITERYADDLAKLDALIAEAS